VPDQERQKRTFRTDGEVRAEELHGEKAKQWEKELTDKRLKQELQRAHQFGLDPAESIEDKELTSTFARGEMPNFAGINTFLKTPLPRGYSPGRRLRGHYRRLSV
jgi:hypothetical protein